MENNTPNQNPEQKARDIIDLQLKACGWTVQDTKKINLHAGIGVAVREFQTDAGPADYVLFVNGKPCGVIEAKREEEGHRLSVHEDQTENYAHAKLKHLKNEPLPFTYISTGEVTSFTDFTDPKPRSRPVFTFHRPETISGWLKNDKSLRKRLQNLPELHTSDYYRVVNAFNFYSLLGLLPEFNITGKNCSIKFDLLGNFKMDDYKATLSATRIDAHDTCVGYSYAIWPDVGDELLDLRHVSNFSSIQSLNYDGNALTLFDEALIGYYKYNIKGVGENNSRGYIQINYLDVRMGLTV